MEYCCERMAFDQKRTCEHHSDRFDCPDMLIARMRGGYYGIIVHDGGSSLIEISFCPWCGEKLPEKTVLPDEEEDDAAENEN